MNIRITGTLERTRTEPERAEVAVGETVQWSIEVTGGTRSVEWEIYFENESPFRRRSYRVRTEAQSLTIPAVPETGVHVGRIDAGIADEPGEYKYGVKATDETTRRALSDDDPYIIVRRRPRQTHEH
jgi:hypothetical protein